jgi:hypothetical protein
MTDNFDIFAGIPHQTNPKPQAQEEDFFNLLATNSNQPTPAPQAQPTKLKNGPLFEEDDVLDQLEGKKPNAPFEESKFTPLPS